MVCKTCGSDSVQKLPTEMTITFPTLEKTNAEPVYVCQQASVCLNCGFTELWVPAKELDLLKNDGLHSAHKPDAPEYLSQELGK